MSIAGITTTKVQPNKVASSEVEEQEIVADMYKRPITGQEVVEVLSLYYKYLGFTIQLEWNTMTLHKGGSKVGVWDIDPTLWQESKEYIPKWALLHFLTQRVDIELEEMGYELPKFRWRPHQIGEGRRLWAIVKANGWGLVRHMPRTGKTGTVLYAMEHSDKALDILIVTTKNGVKGVAGSRGGWIGFIELAQSSGWLVRHSYTLSTPHRVKKHIERVEGGKPFSICVIDESHKIYSEPKPKPSSLWLDMRRVTSQSPCIFVTATPHAQSINQLYWQLVLCLYNPFLKEGIKSFEDYFMRYGKPYTQILGNGVAIPKYDKGDVEAVYRLVNGCILSLSQEDVGFDESLLPIDVKRYVEIGGVTKALMEEYAKKEMIVINGVTVHSMNSSDIPMRLHQLEGGTLKYVDVFSTLDESGVRIRGIKPKQYDWFIGLDKIQYILDTWGDSEDLVIMYHYVNEGKLLRKHFKKAKVYQGKTHSEAIDLWQYKTMVIYSMDYSVATYVQRRDRQVHLTNRVEPIEVYYLLVRGGISEEIYESVVEKGEDYTYKYYR